MRCGRQFTKYRASMLPQIPSYWLSQNEDRLAPTLVFYPRNWAIALQDWHSQDWHFLSISEHSFLLPRSSTISTPVSFLKIHCIRLTQGDKCVVLRGVLLLLSFSITIRSIQVTSLWKGSVEINYSDQRTRPKHLLCSVNLPITAEAKRLWA